MGYTGTIVVGRSAGLLVDHEGMDGFGHRHRTVRPLGDDWQLVETGGRFRAPDLRQPCRLLAVSTGRPVLAAQVFDSDWALLCTAVGDSTVSVTRLGRIQGLAPPQWIRRFPSSAGRSVVRELVQWSTAAGLRADPAAVRAAMAEGQPADGAVFALVRALGTATPGRPLPRAFPVEGWPFSSVSDLASIAQARAATREKEDEAEPPAPWEAAAIMLDAELWAAAYRPSADVASLARQAVDLWTARELERGRTGTRADDLTQLETLLAGGRLNPEPGFPDSLHRW